MTLMEMFKGKVSLQYLALEQKPTDTANDKLLVGLGFLLIIKLKVHLAKLDKNCFSVLPYFLSEV